MSPLPHASSSPSIVVWLRLSIILKSPSSRAQWTLVFKSRIFLMSTSDSSLFRAPAVEGRVKTSDKLTCWLAPHGFLIWFLIWGEDKGGQRGWARGVAWVVSLPLWWFCVQGTYKVPSFALNILLFLLAPQKWQLGFWGLFVSYCS